MRRFSLATKLALILSTFSLALVLVILLLLKAGFDRGFERYINEAIAARMAGLAQQLAQEPEQFPELLHNPRLWDRYLRQFLRDPFADTGSATDTSSATETNPLIPNENFADENASAGGSSRDMSSPRDMARWRVIRRSIWLLDANGEAPGREAPPAIEDLRSLPINAADGVVGYLAWRPVKPRDNALDAHFAARQHQLFLWIAFGAVIASCLIAWPLSRYLINPVRRLSLAMGALTQRDYAQRVPVNSGDELGDLARDFNVMAQALEEQDNQQRQWLADISHELRTPLAVMKGELEAVEDGVMVMDAALTRSLGEEVNQLTRLVDDLHQLAITQISYFRYQWQSLELGQFMQQMQARLVPLLQQAELEWELQTPEAELWVRADSLRLEQLVLNLVQNSVRYTDRGGKVRVRLERAERIRLIWEDSAPGVDEADLQHLFDRFYRVEHSRQRALGGSGLGLAIVGNIAEAHNAQITARESSLGGLAIVLDFPVAETRM